MLIFLIISIWWYSGFYDYRYACYEDSGMFTKEDRNYALVIGLICGPFTYPLLLVPKN